MLSLVLVVLIGSAAISLLRLEIVRARSVRDSASVKRLHTAMQEVRRYGERLPVPIRFPIDSSASHWIQVESLENDASSDRIFLKATEFRDGKEVFTVEQQIKSGQP